MKFYLHKELNKGLFVFIVLFVGSYFMTRDAPNDFGKIGLLSFTGLLVILGMWAVWNGGKDEFAQLNRYEKVEVVIRENELFFPKDYFFRQASVYPSKVVPEAIISELTLNTWPISIVINNNEVIFLKSELKDELIEFAARNKIPVSERPDIWSMINEPFLDTEFTREEAQETMVVLAENGVPATETEAIRKKVKLAMMITVYFTWEWQYFGQIDHLFNVGSGSKNYWRSMEIALRNFENKRTNCIV